MERAPGGFTGLKFQRSFGGYTIIEVLLVITISTVLFISAVTVFQGQQGQTEFTQSMQDIRSKIQSYASQVNSGNFDEGQNYTCAVADGRPVLTRASGSTGTNEDCIFLGRAVQAVAGGDTLHVYTVLGARNQYSGGIDTGEPATTITGANPEPACTDCSKPSEWVLVDDYQLLYGTTLLSSTIAGASSGVAYNLVGIYSSLQTNNAGGTNGNTALAIRAYPFSGDDSTVKQSAVKECLEESVAPCKGVSDITTWNLCFQSADTKHWATLSVNSQSTGITTQLRYEECT